jgi:hypothetical protein
MTLTACGCLMIYHAKNSLYLSLGILWLALPAYRLCYALEPSWKSLNGWLPAAMCVCCFTFIGYSSRRPSRVR